MFVTFGSWPPTPSNHDEIVRSPHFFRLHRPPTMHPTILTIHVP